MLERWPNLRSSVRDRRLGSTLSSATATTQRGALDLLSVVESSQALAGEIVQSSVALAYHGLRAKDSMNG